MRLRPARHALLESFERDLHVCERVFVGVTRENLVIVELEGTTILELSVRDAEVAADLSHPLEPLGHDLHVLVRDLRALGAGKETEVWCLENMAIPITAIGRFARDLPFWVRLDYRVQDQPPQVETESPFTLRTLIEALSRRRPDESPGRTLEAGPFRIGN